MECYVYRAVPSSSPSLSHHGIKGQKWGVRRFQNPDGSLTPEGRRRYLTTIGGQTDLSKAGGKAVSKYLDKNPGNYRNPLLDNEWEHDFGTSEFVKEVTYAKSDNSRTI